jgi:hypothetical protein
MLRRQGRRAPTCAADCVQMSGWWRRDSPGVVIRSVEPGCRGRGEMNLEARVLGELLLTFGCLWIVD